MEEDKADLGGNLETVLSLETGDEKVSISIEGSSVGVVEFMEMVEMLLVNAKYDKKDVEAYVLQWAKDIKVTREN